MKLLVTSYPFHPSVGGIETTTLALCTHFVEAGHQVTVATASPADPAQPTDVPFPVLRGPSLWDLRRALAEADLLWQNGLSLRLARAWPLAPRPWIVTHQGELFEPGAGWRVRLKAQALRFAHSVAISTAVGESLHRPGWSLIPNPYRDSLFRLDPPGPRPWALGFLGRLVSDKGADLLLEALAQLPPDLADRRAVIVGDGPERAALEAQAARLGLTDRVEFLGSRQGRDLAETLNRIEVLVVPSRWAEPFGIVALEGLACGCALVVSRGGGLPEAAGPDQASFANGDPKELADRLTELLRDEDRRRRAAAAGLRHVEDFTVARIAGRYLELFERTLRDAR